MFDVAWQRNRGDGGMRYPYATAFPICSSLSVSEDLYLLDGSVEQSALLRDPQMGFSAPDRPMCKRRGEGPPVGVRRGHWFVASTVGRESILEPCSHPLGEANQPRNEDSAILAFASFLLDDSPDFLNYYPFENQQLSTWKPTGEAKTQSA